MVTFKKYWTHTIFALFAISFFVPVTTNAASSKKKGPKYFSETLCSDPQYVCKKVKGGDTWKKLYPDKEMRDIVQRVNRSNTRLRVGRTLAIPKNLKTVTIWDVSPFPKQIKAPGTKLIVVDQNKLAWAAYNPNGEIEWWGPISSGKDYCKDIKRSCRTQHGTFYTFNKKDARCKSRIFPVDEGGGARMPYCMFFYRGYALHGSNEVYGYRDSHGCIRMFTRDAKWLNLNFVDLTNKKGDKPGTKVIIKEL